MLSILYSRGKGEPRNRGGAVVSPLKQEEAIHISSDDSSVENEGIVQSSKGNCQCKC